MNAHAGYIRAGRAISSRVGRTDVLVFLGRLPGGRELFAGPLQLVVRNRRHPCAMIVRGGSHRCP